MAIYYRTRLLFLAAAALLIPTLVTAAPETITQVPANAPEELRPILEKLCTKDYKARREAEKALKAMGNEVDVAIPFLIQMVAQHFGDPNIAASYGERTCIVHYLTRIHTLVVDSELFTWLLVVKDSHFF